MATAKKLPSGSWRVQVYAGKDLNGKRLYESFTADTKKEAEFLAAEFAAGKKKRSGGLTFGEAVEQYITVKGPALSPSTILGYRKIQRNNFGPLLSVPCDQITDVTAQRLIGELSKDHSPKTVRNVFGLFTAVMKFAGHKEPFEVYLPQRERDKIVIPTMAEIAELSHAVKGRAIELPFLLAVQCGLRASEICALCLKPENVKDDRILIDSAYVNGIEGLVLKKPKSSSGNREIMCSTSLCEMLRGNDRRYTTAKISKLWGQIQEKNVCARRFNFHALRHYFASRAITLGIPIDYVARLMGHSSRRMIEQVYFHVFQEDSENFGRLLLKDFENMQHEMQHENEKI